MSCELSNCLLCLPLKLGLLIYGCVALVINYLSVLHTLFQLNDFFEETRMLDSHKFIDLSLTFAILIIHFIFHIVLMSGLHKGSRGLLEVFYGYQVILVIAEVVIASLYLPLQVYKNYETLKYSISIPVVTGFSLFICILLQVYLITCVRSFIAWLDDGKGETYQSTVNTLDDTECTLQFYNKTKEYCHECDP